jgi:2-dehydro-3-deoxygluconokinase
MENRGLLYDISTDDLSIFDSHNPAFVTFGETMVRETPADQERPERTRMVSLSMAGSELTLAIGLQRLGIPSAYITRVPNNPYGKSLEETARGQGVNTNYFVWAPATEPIGRMIYEISCTPRKNVAVYQRMYSAASRLGAGMVKWTSALQKGKLFHTSGITFGLANHSHYDKNYNLEAFEEALQNKPEGCRIGMDFNYRATLWSIEQAKKVLTPIVKDHVDVLITTIEDMAKLYGIDCGHYSADQIDAGDVEKFNDEDIRAFSRRVLELFGVEIVAITIRYPDTFERHRWESAAMKSNGEFFRSPNVRPIILKDRLGGGDTWNAGFYYGLLTEGFTMEGVKKGVLVGDAFSRLKQTLMFDLPIVTKSEIQSLLKEDIVGGGKRVSR